MLIQMEGILANILSQIYAYEDNIFECIASFITNVTGLDVWLKDKPFIAPDGQNPYITVRLVTSNNSNGVGQYYQITEDGSSQYVVDNTYQVEIMAFRGRPFPVLTYLLGAFISFKEQAYQDLYSKGISFLSASNVSEANTVLDKNETRLGARLIATFNTRMIIEDAPTTEITSVKYSTTSYQNSYEDQNPIERDGDFTYITT